MTGELLNIIYTMLYIIILYKYIIFICYDII